MLRTFVASGFRPLCSIRSTCGPCLKSSVLKRWQSGEKYTLPSTATLIVSPEGDNVIVLGTVHFSKKSIEDVTTVMKAVVPHAVVIELCRQRVSILELDDETFLKEAQNMDKEKIKNAMKGQDFFSGVMHSVLLKSYADISKELGVAPGGEFRRAYKEMKKIPGCKLYLGDRQIQVTIARAFGQLSFREILQIVFHVSKKPNKPISKQELEMYKSQEYINNQFKEITHDFPAFKKIFDTFVNERDICLAYSIQEAVKGVAFKPARVVAVVGMGHVEGIVKNLGKVKRDDVMKLLSAHPLSPYRWVLRVTIKYTFLFLVFSFFYRLLFG